MKKIYSETSSVRQYHLHQDVISQLMLEDDVLLKLVKKENGYEDVFAFSSNGEIGQLFSENGDELKKYFNPKYSIVSKVKKILDKEDGMKAVVIEYNVFENDSINQNPVTPNPITPNPVKPKSKLGCFRFFLIGFALLLVSWFMWKQCSKSEAHNTTKLDDTVVVVDDLALQDNMKGGLNSKVDSLKIKELKQFFTEKKDEFESYTWVKPKSRPMYTNQNGFYCYFQKNSDGSVSNLRFVGQYFADEWLFINSAKFNIDGQTFTFVPTEMKRDNGAGEIWEWYDDSVDYSNSHILEAISKAKSVKIRFNGDQYYDDKTMNASTIQSIKRTVEYYKALGGRY